MLNTKWLSQHCYNTLNCNTYLLFHVRCLHFPWQLCERVCVLVVDLQQCFSFEAALIPFCECVCLCFLLHFGCLGSIEQNYQNTSQIPLKFPFGSITYRSYLTDLVISETLQWWWILTSERLIGYDDIWMSEVEILQILWPLSFIKYSEWPGDLKYSSHKWQLKRLCRYIYSDLRLKRKVISDGSLRPHDSDTKIWARQYFYLLIQKKSSVMVTSNLR